MTAVEQPRWTIDYGQDFEAEIARIQKIIEQHTHILAEFEPRWLAIKLLEGEPDLDLRLSESPGGREILREIRHSQIALEPNCPDGIQIAFADKRYALVNKVVSRSLNQPEQRSSISEKVDRIVTNPYLGFPIFLFVMYLVFNLVVNVSAPYLDWIDSAITGPISSWITGTALFLLAVVAFDAFTNGWKRRQLVGWALSILFGLVVTGSDGVEGLPLWIVEGAVTGIVLLAVWVLVLRHHPALVPLVTATGAAFGAVREAVVGAYPGATFGSAIGALAVLAASWWWFKRLTSDAALQASTGPSAGYGDDSHGVEEDS